MNPVRSCDRRLCTYPGAHHAIWSRNAGSDVEPKHASNLESAIASLERSSIVPLNQEDRAIAWMHCFTLWCARSHSMRIDQQRLSSDPYLPIVNTNSLDATGTAVSAFEASTADVTPSRPGFAMPAHGLQQSQASNLHARALAIQRASPLSSSTRQAPRPGMLGSTLMMVLIGYYASAGSRRVAFTVEARESRNCIERFRRICDGP